MQINTRYKRVLYMDLFTMRPASLPAAYRAAARSAGHGAYSGHVKPCEPSYLAEPALTAAVVFADSERILRKKFVSPDFKWTIGRRHPTVLRSFLTTWFIEDNGQRQVKKMSTARIRQRLIKAGFTEAGLEGLSREELMNKLAEHMIKQELSSSEEEEEEEEEEDEEEEEEEEQGAVGGAKVKEPPGQTVELDPLPTFVNPPMTMESMMQMMMMMMMRQDEERRRQDEEKRRREEKQEEKEEKRRREEKKEQEEKEENGDLKRKSGDLRRKKKRKNGDLKRKSGNLRRKKQEKEMKNYVDKNWRSKNSSSRCKWSN